MLLTIFSHGGSAEGGARLNLSNFHHPELGHFVRDRGGKIFAAYLDGHHARPILLAQRILRWHREAELKGLKARSSGIGRTRFDLLHCLEDYASGIEDRAGRWLIGEARHELSDRGFTTQLQLETAI